MDTTINKICPYCKTQFTENDDVVVCSACEMPHHKECWIENSGCTTFGCQGTISNLEMNLNSSDNEVKEEPHTNTRFCGKCGTENNLEYQYCTRCGAPLSAGHDAINQTGASRAADEREIGMDQYLRVFVRGKEDYYLPKFTKFRDSDEKASWNWAAFFLSMYWLLYRKQYRYFAIVIGANVAAAFFPEPFYTILVFGIMALCGIFGNYFYYKHAVRTITELSPLSENERQNQLLRRSETSMVGPVILIIVVIVLQVWANS